jgi:hypothetical protein
MNARARRSLGAWLKKACWRIVRQLDLHRDAAKAAIIAVA